jgi:hypothetical protein
VEIGALAEIFARPAGDPFTGPAEERSGIERLEAELAGRSAKQMPVAVDWTLPAGAAGTVAGAALGDAVARWCAAQGAVVADTLAAQAVERRQAVLTGGLFFVVCFALAAGFSATGAGESLGIGLLTESFVIAGWVGIWRAVELVLYAPWPLRARARVLARIAAMEHRIREG